MSASLLPRHRRLSLTVAALICASTMLPAQAVATAETVLEKPANAVVLNVRDFGAIGDGRVHLVKEWLREGRFRSLSALQNKYPFVDNLEWSVDEVAFAAALGELPPAGGTIHFPVGRYIAAKRPWQIWRDHVRLTGDGADRTILATTPNIAEGLVIAPYRHIGWIEGAAYEYPYASTSGSCGEGGVLLIDANWAREFQRGELVFVRSGANRFDQDYGEFNEIAGTDPDGRLRCKIPFVRDYTLSRFNWATETAEDCTMPAENETVHVKLRSGPDYFIPSERMTVSIGENLFTVEKTSPVRRGSPVDVTFKYRGRGSTPPGTLIPAGSKVGKSRAILKLTRTVRNFRCENLQIVGRRKALNLSNTYGSCFADCTFVRDLRDGGFQGGLTIDGDGGRFARFERCKIIARPAAGMQFARSFGSVLFSGCTFVDANVAFTEFNFDCEVSRCKFEINGAASLSNAIVAGKSCGNLRFIDNEIRATQLASVLDGYADIQSQKHGSEGDIIVRGNIIETDHVGRTFAVPKSEHFVIENNRVTSK